MSIRRDGRPRRSHVRFNEPRRRGGSRLALVAVAFVVAVAGVAVASAMGHAGGDGISSRSSRGTPVTRAPVPPPEPGHETFGFVPYWEFDDGLPEHLATTELTTLALFSVTHRADGSMDDDETGYRRLAGDMGRRILDEAHARGTRVEVTWTSFGTEKNRTFFGNRSAQDRWLTVLVAHVAERGYDGVNVDVESLPPDLVPAYGSFVGRLREALRAMNREAQVSVATGASALGAAMAAVAAGAGADRIFLMGYDYRTAGSEPGASAPLDRVDGEKDLAWSLDLYRGLGVPAERTILGLPLYGVTWPVIGPGMGSMATGRGDAWVPRRHLDLLKAPDFAPTFDPTESVEFWSAGEGTRWTAVYYDSPRSLRPKLALANERGLAGAGFWAIGYERGLPAYTELIAEFASGELRVAGR